MALEKLRGPQTDALFEAILELRDLDECYRFFDDLATISEVQSLSQRLNVARMLKMGYTYENIKNETGASTATISRVRRCFDYGSGGYVEILARMEEEDKEEEKA
ncbi:Trp operon repressor family [Bhargavaea ginsengi]|uniref:Trp operon repressor family n=1 Tax=Bhargavaea ginsengi TaxID=426757 RepID=A0A1H7B0Z6_9BACL|nr:YerC/YecD family TrpR-related protein [Bhargavaea ginsengi]MCM3088068.1 YerC/YecD family TrpR-related protein [Bhargavaea ginsengi]SEJ70826.1 Trp operon repressor family [Bhargavaea ginsengi]